MSFGASRQSKLYIYLLFFPNGRFLHNMFNNTPVKDLLVDPLASDKVCSI